jgi:hypothetical protein
VAPGDPDGSLLVRAVRHAEDVSQMPPGKHLPAAAVADLSTWVKQGAPWPAAGKSTAFRTQRHWAFEPVRPVEPPEDPSGWSTHPIDRFVALRREHGLTPVEPADRRTLIRRLTFDLTGLPPTPTETATFLADESPGAYTRLVDRLLASPRYGERWGRHWLDVAHYADTAGDNADYPVPELTRYRDYVIAAFNQDKPFDVFVREQLSGDLIGRDGPPTRYAERVIGTGFLALSRRYGTAPYELWHLTLEDTIETTGRAFLGLSLRCARCHDHKYDPVTQEDYYALYGIFASTEFPWAGGEEFQSMKRPREHFAALIPPELVEKRLAEWNAVSVPLEAEVGKAEAAMKSAKPSEMDEAKTALAKARDGLFQLRRRGLPAGVPSAYAVGEAKPVDVPLQRKGDPGNPGPVIPRGLPAFLTGGSTPRIASHESGRRELAEWLTRPGHPLTARVMVNRIWQHHFGRGIVATSSNFGTRGDEPSHPQLLDWLAARFVAEGWSIKAMHRLIVSSKTYQLASRLDPSDAVRDPANRSLWRFERRRLDAEALRDAMLAVSGRLDQTLAGAQPFPPIEDWHWTQHKAFRAVYPTNRRTVYMMTQRLQRHPYLALFDGPDTNASTDVRTRATVPLQALYLRNNAFVGECAVAFAKRLAAATEDPTERITLATALAWNRPPQHEEVQRFLRYQRDYEQATRSAGAPGERIESETWASLARVILTANEFLYVD